MTPAVEPKPSEGLIADAPLHAAGKMIEPPVSSPSVAAASRAIGATPEPWLEPPGTWSRLQALPENVPAIEPENAEQIVIPSATTPWSRSRPPPGGGLQPPRRPAEVRGRPRPPAPPRGAGGRRPAPRGGRPPRRP